MSGAHKPLGAPHHLGNDGLIKVLGLRVRGVILRFWVQVLLLVDCDLGCAQPRVTHCKLGQGQFEFLLLFGGLQGFVCRLCGVFLDNRVVFSEVRRRKVGFV